MEIHASRASAVAVHRVPPDAEERFVEWQRGVTAAVAAFPGYRGTDLYPPTADGPREWVAVVHFADAEALRGWLESPVRADWLGRLREVCDFDLTALPGGFGPWFAGLARGAAGPASWQTALAVLLGLYPTVMLLTLGLGPYTNPLGLAVGMLIGNVLSVAALQWVVMPLLTRALAGWLAPKVRKPAAIATGTVLLIAGLVGLALAFRAVAG